MTEGFGVVAYPARWGVSGVMTYLVGPDGKVLEKNLGKTTVMRAKDWRRIDQPPKWWARQDSNLRQRRYERRVLTAELQAPTVRIAVLVALLNCRCTPSSWPGLTRPSTPKAAQRRSVDARVKLGHDGREVSARRLSSPAGA